MYEIRIDGQLLFTTAGVDDEHIILSPKLSPAVDGAGSLTFVMPPGHALYDSVKKLKGIITVTQDEDIIFRGRVLETEKDFYNQKTVYCEGDLSFLLDSIYAPGKLSGNVKAFFNALIENHNEQVDAEKHFTVGIVDAVDDDETLNQASRTGTRIYWNTSDMINDSLLDVYGGYLRTRTENGVTYIDWLKKSGDTNSQVIEFAVNLLDLKDKIDASDVFTVLLPQGYAEIEDGEYGEPVSIASVNNGVEYIQDDEAVALYGKIWRTKRWDWIEDPAKLLKKAREYLKTGIAVQTLKLKLIDMRFITGSADAIRVGQYVRILSDPHGLDITLPCTEIDIDLLDPENSTYTFGERQQMLTENVTRTEKDVGNLTGKGRGGGGGRSIKEEVSDVLRWAKFSVDEANANINLNAGEINKIEDRVSLAEIDIDGVEAEILLKASRKETDELGERLTAAEIEIDGANAEIKLKANATTVNSLGERVTSAELELDGLNSQITLKADKIDLQGFVTADYLSSNAVTLHAVSVTGALVASSISCTNLGGNKLNIAGNSIKLDTITAVTSVSGKSTHEIAVRDGEGNLRTVIAAYSVTYKTTDFDVLTY